MNSYTEEWLRERQARIGQPGGVIMPSGRRTSAPPMRSPGANPQARLLALGRLPEGEQNGTEKAYDQRLAMLLRAGEILWYRFEPLTLRLAPRTTYRPDFGVIAKDSVLELHETKGFWREDARVKIKVAAELFPVFRFVAVQKGRAGSWTREEF